MANPVFVGSPETDGLPDADTDAIETDCCALGVTADAVSDVSGVPDTLDGTEADGSGDAVCDSEIEFNGDRDEDAVVDCERLSRAVADVEADEQAESLGDTLNDGLLESRAVALNMDDVVSEADAETEDVGTFEPDGLPEKDAVSVGEFDDRELAEKLAHDVVDAENDAETLCVKRVDGVFCMLSVRQVDAEASGDGDVDRVRDGDSDEDALEVAEPEPDGDAVPGPNEFVERNDTLGDGDGNALPVEEIDTETLRVTEGDTEAHDDKLGEPD